MSSPAKLRRDRAPAIGNLARAVNLILFEAEELARPLPRSDRRAQHILGVLRRDVGESFDVAVINGARGKATLTAAAPDALTLAFAWPAKSTEAPQPRPLATRITVIVGLPRPQTARDILRDATTLGVGALHFVTTEKSERNYAQSTLWTSGEWRRHVILGAEQAFDPRLPEVTFGRPLADALALLAATPDAAWLALDNYESPRALGQCPLSGDKPVALAIGAERGWSGGERAALRTAGFQFAHLGERVLRTETAVTAALAIVRAKLGLM